jgi:hypothetical protein
LSYTHLIGLLLIQFQNETESKAFTMTIPSSTPTMMGEE